MEGAWGYPPALQPHPRHAQVCLQAAAHPHLTQVCRQQHASARSGSPSLSLLSLINVSPLPLAYLPPSPALPCCLAAGLVVLGTLSPVVLAWPTYHLPPSPALPCCLAAGLVVLGTHSLVVLDWRQVVKQAAAAAAAVAATQVAAVAVTQAAAVVHCHPAPLHYSWDMHEGQYRPSSFTMDSTDTHDDVRSGTAAVAAEEASTSSSSSPPSPPHLHVLCYMFHRAPHNAVALHAATQVHGGEGGGYWRGGGGSPGWNPG